jgi:hypothetical protein
VNAYNAAVVRAVITHYPVESMLRIPGIWDMEIIRVADEPKSLNEIRRADLMDNFRDEKIHFALACGAVDCPALSREAYAGPKVEGQLFQAVRNFVNNPYRVVIVPGEKKIRLSRIFQWYGEDFRIDFAVFPDDQRFSILENSVLSFLAYYLEDARKVDHLESRQFKIKYLPFNWRLNDRPRRTVPPSAA